MDLLKRPRRNRLSPAIRDLVQETRLHSSDFVIPFFVLSGSNRKEAIPSMPGIYRFSKDLIIKEIEAVVKQGVLAIALFPVIPE
ncbi:MAG: porphobilinogen synthase, partial [Chlamydiae bacterium]|nr:porphobilinogen synthase [Chlamydiota bacterium]